MAKLNPFKSKCGLTSTLIVLLFSVTPQKALGEFGNEQSRRITYSAENILLGHFFDIINKQTGIVIHNNQTETKLNEAKKVSVHFNKADIGEVLNFILNDRKELHFKTNGNNIIIYSNNINTFIKSKNNDTTIIGLSVAGKVTDNAGNPIPGATIKIQKSKNGTITNSDGVFQIPHINKGDIISISSIGFESTDVEIKNKIVSATLKSHTNKLDEKIVIAYGKTTRRFNTGNIGRVTAEEIEKQPVNNPILALEGRVAGLFIEQASGVPGTGVKVSIQGRNSISKGNDPFYVVDDVPYMSQLMQPASPGVTAGSSGITGNPLNFISPSDIESIEILKDADATAIYGSRAANGAILITTKKGKTGSLRINFNIQKGWGEVSHKLQVMNAQEYLEMRHEALKNDGISTPSDVDYDLNGVWDTTKTKDWQKELIGGTAQYNDIQLGFSGGNNQTQYLISGNYHKETNVFPGDFSDIKGSTHFNIRSASSNQKFRIELSGSYMRDKNSLPIADLTSAAIQLAPVVPDLLNPDGSLNWAPTASGASTNISNPLTYIKQKYSNKTDNLISQANISYDIVSWLTVKSSFGYNTLNSNEFSASPLQPSRNLGNS